MDKIIDNLYLGDIQGASNMTLLKRNGITHILQVAAGFKPFFPGEFQYLVINVLDMPFENLQKHFKAGIDFIKQAIKSGGSILVHCFAGISRSASVVIAYLMKELGLPMLDALTYVRKRRPIIFPNPGFQRQLFDFEKHLRHYQIQVMADYQEKKKKRVQEREMLLMQLQHKKKQEANEMHITGNQGSATPQFKTDSMRKQQSVDKNASAKQESIKNLITPKRVIDDFSATMGRAQTSHVSTRRQTKIPIEERKGIQEQKLSLQSSLLPRHSDNSPFINEHSKLHKMMIKEGHQQRHLSPEVQKKTDLFTQLYPQTASTMQSVYTRDFSHKPLENKQNSFKGSVLDQRSTTLIQQTQFKGAPKNPLAVSQQLFYNSQKIPPGLDRPQKYGNDYLDGKPQGRYSKGESESKPPLAQSTQKRIPSAKPTHQNYTPQRQQDYEQKYKAHMSSTQGHRETQGMLLEFKQDNIPLRSPQNTQKVSNSIVSTNINSFDNQKPQKQNLTMASHILSQTAYQSFNSGGVSSLGNTTVSGQVGISSSVGAGNSSNGLISSQVQSMYATSTSLVGSIPQGGSRIKVAVRIRPLLENERTQGHECSRLKVQNTNEVVIANDDQNGSRQKAFRFDQVFHQGTTQADVYHGLGLNSLVNKVIEGYHGTIFAYGQTGSGKTFTMEGYDFNGGATQTDFNKKASKAQHTSENVGITQRCIFELYGQLGELRKTERTSGRHYQVFCSFLQIYNEKVFDLLNQSTLNTFTGGKKTATDMPNKQQQGLRIRWTKKDQFVVENLFVFECQTAEEALELFRLGSKNRILASHNLNDLSSRSHTIFCMTIESQDIAHQEMVTVSKLQLVDLAGSEKQGLTGTTGQQAKESIDINKSLLVLRKVITALTEQKPGNNDTKMNFIPYRESKLTCLLKQSLGGNSYTLMVACLSPSDRYLEENLSTLNYAARASLISNVPTKNIDPRLMEIDEQKRKISDLEKELKSANQHIQFLTQINEERARRIQVLEAQIKMGRMEGDMSQSDAANYDSPVSKLPLIKKNDSVPVPNQQPSQSQSQVRPVMSPGGKNNGGGTPAQVQQFSQLSTQKRTQMNLYLQQDKQKMDAAAERLIHSVNAVTDLLKANTELRDTIEKMRRSKEDSDSEVFTLNIENQTLRERLELVEGILKNNREGYEQMVSDKVKNIMHKSNTQYGKFNMNASLEQQPDFTIDAVYTELIQLRQQNRVLETRIKQLELQNFNITRSGGFNTAASANKPTPVRNIEPNRPIFERPKQEGSLMQEGGDQEYDEEDEYDDEDEEDDDELMQHQQQSKSGGGQFMLRLDQANDPSNLVNIPPQQSKRNQNNGFQGSSHHNAESHPQMMIPDAKSQLRKESQPVPDQRYYTKTNFFTINGGDGESNMSIADKYAHLHSQKMQRPKINQDPASHYQSSEHDHMQLHQRIQSFTEGLGQANASISNRQMMAAAAQSSPAGYADQEYFSSKNRGGSHRKYVNDQSMLSGGLPSDFDSSGVLVKRKVKKKRLMQTQGLPNGPPPSLHHQLQPDSIQLQQQMIPQQQTNNNISMVMVMSNLMTKRKNRKKRTSNSVYQKVKQPLPQQSKQQFQNQDFYF